MGVLLHSCQLSAGIHGANGFSISTKGSKGNAHVTSKRKRSRGHEGLLSTNFLSDTSIEDVLFFRTLTIAYSHVISKHIMIQKVRHEQHGC